MKSASKRARSAKKVEKELEIFDEPEMNSDFESVSEGESEDEDTRESFSNEPELAATAAIDERQEVNDEFDNSTPIRFQIRSPEVVCTYQLYLTLSLRMNDTLLKCSDQKMPVF